MVRKVAYYTHDVRPDKDEFLEYPSGEILVEPHGYETAQKKIERMIFAGQRLALSRKEHFDFPPGTDIEEDFYDPTRRLDYDLSDATQSIRDLEERAFEAKKAQRNKEGQEDAQRSAEQVEEPTESIDSEKIPD